MVLLKSLEDLGCDKAFFRLPEGEPGKEDFSYYTFEYKWDLKHMTHWNIIGVRRREEKSLFLELVLFSIEEEALGWKPFEPWADASGFLNLGQSEVLALIELLLSLLDQDVQDTSMLIYFSPLQEGDVERMHIKTFPPDMSEKGYYFYLYDELELDQTQENICLMRFPRWFSQRERCQSSLLYISSNHHCLDDPSFDLVDMSRPQIIPFNQQSLSEFVYLLRNFLP